MIFRKNTARTQLRDPQIDAVSSPASDMTVRFILAEGVQ
jgi:hypothetical protein